MHFAHSKGVVHLDLKTDNVMLGEYGEVYLVDWGISASFKSEAGDSLWPRVMEMTEPRGTPGFMAPEIASATPELIDARTDVYLLGGVLHYLVLGSTRHRGKDLYAVLASAFASEPVAYGEEMPEALGEICNKAMARQPAERYASAEALRQAVARFRRQREGARLVEEARALLQELIALSRRGRPRSSALYRVYGELTFALRRAEKLGLPRVEGLRGAALRVMIDFELAREQTEAARELLSEVSQWNASDGRRMKQLEELEERLRRDRQWVDHVTEEHEERDATISAKARGLMLAGAVIVWAAVAAVARLMLDHGLAHETPAALIAIKAVNTLFAVTLIWGAPRVVRLNRINRRIFSALAVAMLIGLAIRAICALHGVAIALSLSLETLVNLTCVAMLALFVERRLGRALPLFALGAACSLWLPEHAWWLMIAWNVAGLAVVAGVWLKTEPAG